MEWKTLPRWGLRALIIVALTVVLVAIIFAAPACSKKVATGDFSVPSSTDSGHSHNVTVLGKDVDTPPSQATYTSTVVGGHTHQITLSKADLDAIRNGQSVTVTSTPAGSNGHTHVWTIKKP